MIGGRLAIKGVQGRCCAKTGSKLVLDYRRVSWSMNLTSSAVEQRGYSNVMPTAQRN
jgi:hypothetical protein